MNDTHNTAHGVFARQRLMVMAAPNGARRSRRDFPGLPETPGQLAREAVELVDAGVSVLHLHVRDAKGRHTLDTATYRSAIEAIRGAVGDQLVIQVTTEAVGRYSPAGQMAMVRELRPEAVSIALQEICPTAAEEAGTARFFSWLIQSGIWPQVILYSPDQLVRYDHLRKAGLFGHRHPHCLLVLGRYQPELQGSLAQLEAFLAATDCSRFPWTACCFGPQEQAVMSHVVSLGGHVRMGFENNVLHPDGSPARSNAELIAHFRSASGASQRQWASADEVRALIGQGRRVQS